MAYLTSKQAAEHLGISYESLRGYVLRGKLVPDLRPHSNLLLWTVATLDASGIRPRTPRGKGRTPLLTPEQITAARQDRQKGRSAAAIAAELGVGPHVVYHNTGALTKKRPTLTENQRNQVRALAKQGIAQNEIAARLGVTTGQVWRALNVSGVKKAKNSPP